jgi:hypothetical protein
LHSVPGVSGEFYHDILQDLFFSVHPAKLAQDRLGFEPLPVFFIGYKARRSYSNEIRRLKATQGTMPEHYS